MTGPTMSSRFADDAEQALTDLVARPAAIRRATASSHPVRTLVVTVAVLAVLVPLVVIAIQTSGRSAPQLGTSPAPSLIDGVPVHERGASLVIGALPERSSLILHGTAPLQPVDPAYAQDLRGYARKLGKDPDQFVDDNAATLPFEHVPDTCRASGVTCDAAVFHPGVHAASEVRFRTEPSRAVLDRLQASYPRDLEIEWGDHLLTDDERGHFNAVVFDLVDAVPHAKAITAGFPASEELDVEYAGSAPLRSVAQAIVASPEFRATFIDGQPPTEVVLMRTSAAVVQFQNGSARPTPTS